MDPKAIIRRKSRIIERVGILFFFIPYQSGSFQDKKIISRNLKISIEITVQF